MSHDRPAGRETGTDISLTEGRNCWRLARAERFGWLIDGEDYFRAVRDSIGAARREIVIVGWDMDSRVELIRDKNDARCPSPLYQTLQECIEANDALEVYVLSWDFAMLYMLERELMPAWAFGWQTSKRLRFELDDTAANGASHHQKLVIVDGCVGYIGGFDLTKNRWDTRAHAADDARRIDPAGEPYSPFHDVQAVVSGEAARILRELASSRWERAIGEPLPALDSLPAEDAWPQGVPVRASDVEVALSRTRTEADGDDIEEVKHLYLDMIGAARHGIYIENQYFTSASIAEALARRLGEDDGPEVVLVLPRASSGWLEQATMDVLRNQALATIKKADEHGRLRILTPVADALGDTSINVHAKLMVVDLRWLRIGSANLSSRSMSLDSECDLTLDAGDDDTARLLCADLLAEHMGADMDDVAASLAEAGLFDTIDRYNGGERRLDPLPIEETEFQAVLEPLVQIADLERPLMFSGDSDELQRARDEHVAGQPLPGAAAQDAIPVHTPAQGWLFLGLIAAIIGFWVFLAVSGADVDFHPRAFLAAARDIASHPLAPLAMLPAFVAASLVVTPITGMIAVCALLFDPWVASLTALAGTLLAAAVNHWVGGHFSNVVAARVPRKIAERIKRMVKSSDMWSLAGLRLIPIAPFTIINVAAGAAGVRLRDLLLGTLIGMGPGIVLICLGVDRARAILDGESVFDPWIVAAMAAAGIMLIGLRVWFTRRKKPSLAGS